MLHASAISRCTVASLVSPAALGAAAAAAAARLGSAAAGCGGRGFAVTSEDAPVRKPMGMDLRLDPVVLRLCTHATHAHPISIQRL